MAMSGQSYSNMGSFYRLQLEWSVTSQNTGANASTINARLYLISLNSSSTISSSTSKTFSITIDGVTTSSTGNVSLSGGQKKLLHTHVRTVSHNSNGTKTAAISGNAEMQVTLSGTYYGSRSTSLNAVIDPIDVTPPTPAASTISSAVSWRAGESLAVSISRASTAVTHTVRLYVNNTLIQTKTGVGTSTTFDFTNSGLRTTLFDLIGRNSSATAEVHVDSIYQGSKIGSTHQKEGVVMAGIPSVPTISRTSMTVGQTARVNFNANSGYFNHTVVVQINGIELTRVDAPTGATYLDFNTASYANQIHQILGSRTSGFIYFEVYTKHATQIIREPETRSISINANLASTTPTFDNGFSAVETQTAVGSMMGNLSDVFVSGQSIVQVSLSASQLATAGAGASISYYRISLGNKSTTVNHPSSGGVTATLAYPAGNGYQNLTVTAVDTRGAEVSQYRLVTLLAYSLPTATVTAERVGAFETETSVTFRGNHSSVYFSNTNRNAKVTHRYRVKSGTSAYGSYTNISTGLSTFTTTLQLDNTKSHVIEYTVADRLNTVTRTFTVPAGKPIMFIDSEKNSVGFNMFPTWDGAFEIDGRVRIMGAIASLDVGGNATVGGNLSVEGELIMSLGVDSKIANPTTGMRLYGNSTVGYVELNSSSTLVTYIRTNRSRFEFDSAIHAPSFYGTHYGEQVSYTNKEANGYNKVSMLASPNHGNIMHVQHVSGGFSIGSGQSNSNMNISFPVAFDEVPQWLIISGRDSNSAHLSFSAYSITRFGCTVYGTRLPSTGSGAFSSTYQIIAGGVKN